MQIVKRQLSEILSAQIVPSGNHI